MDWTLWDPTADQAAQESSYYIQGWLCDFYFGYGHDVIEEEALNTESLVQVLRILITKADNEILELEEDLVILQSQLALADKEWSKLCSSTLKEKIKCLDIAIQSLKNENEDSLPSPREPAENIHDILNSLLRGYFQQKVDKQSLEVVSKESRSAHSTHAIKQLEEEKRSRRFASNTIRNEIITTNAEKNMVSETFFKPPYLIQISASNADKLAIGHSKKEKTLSCPNLEINIKSLAKLDYTRTTNSASVFDLSVKTERGKTGVEDVERPETAVVKYQNIDPVTIKEREAKALCSRSINLRPSLGLGGKETETTETVTPTDTGLGSRYYAAKEANEDSNSNPKRSKETEAAISKNITTSPLKKYVRRATSAGKRRVTNSQLEPPNHQKNNITNPRLMKTQELTPSQVQETEFINTHEETNSDLSIQPQSCLFKSNYNSNLSSSSHKNSWFSQSENGAVKEEKMDQLGLCGAKKRKFCQSSKKELVGLDISLASTTEQGRRITDYHLAIESAFDKLELLPCPNVVEYLTLVELRAIGKQQKVKGYYKLRKAELARKLGLEIHGTGRSKGKRSGAGITPLIQGGIRTQITGRGTEYRDCEEGRELAYPKMLRAEEEREHNLELVTC